jgi:hypothetical protein
MAFVRLEPCDASVSSTVLKGLGMGNRPWLLGACQQRGPCELPKKPACAAHHHSSSLSICETGDQIAVIPDL